jgi:hypothetical protein
MQTEDEPLRVVLEGHEPDGTTWSVDVRPDPACNHGLFTHVRRAAPTDVRHVRAWADRSCTAMMS